MELLQPPPLYPPIVSRPLNLIKNDQYKSEIELKKNFRAAMRDSFYFIEANKSEASDFNLSIERYSDRYTKLKKVNLNEWQPVWERLPKELKYFYDEEKNKPTKRKIKSKVAPKLIKRKVKKILDLDEIAEIIAKDEDKGDENEENDENEDEAQVKDKKSDKGSDDEENQDDLENVDEDVEEENDYIDTYFDNGEDYGDDDMGGDDEGPVY